MAKATCTDRADSSDVERVCVYTYIKIFGINHLYRYCLISPRAGAKCTVVHFGEMGPRQSLGMDSNPTLNHRVFSQHPFLRSAYLTGML